MAINPQQMFECLHCGDQVISVNLGHCDQLEGARCGNCDFGHYQWIGPAQRAPQAPVTSMDDVEEDVDQAFEKIMME